MSKLNNIMLGIYDFGFEDVYQEHHDHMIKTFERFFSSCHSILQSVNGTYYYRYEDEMEENGMDKFTNMVIGTLWMIEKGEVEPEQIQVTMEDIRDFESGNFKDLFTPNDYDLLLKDVKKVKEYAAQHPELL